LFDPGISGLQYLLNARGDYAAEHEIAFNYKAIGVCIQLSDQVKYFGVSLNALLKDDDDIQRQVSLLHHAANKLRDTFAQCSTAVKNTLFCANQCRCQLWSKYTQTSTV